MELGLVLADGRHVLDRTDEADRPVAPHHGDDACVHEADLGRRRLHAERARHLHAGERARQRREDVGSVVLVNGGEPPGPLEELCGPTPQLGEARVEIAEAHAVVALEHTDRGIRCERPELRL